MNARKRYLNALNGRPVDRVPIHLLRTVPERAEELARTEPPELRELAERLFHEQAARWGVATHVNRFFVTPPARISQKSSQTPEGEVVRKEIDTPKGKLTAAVSYRTGIYTAWTVKYPCESLEDIEKIRSIPWEVPVELAPPDMGKAPDDLLERYVVHAGVSSPFVCVAGMMPYQYFLELCATERTLIGELTELCTERVLDVLDAVLADNSVDVVWMGGCEWLTPPMGSPGLYEEFVQGPEARIIRRCHEAGAVVDVHCHGNVRSTIEQVIERGGDFFEPVEPPPDGDITFAEAKAVSAGRMSLGGNIEARVLERAEGDQVEAAVRAAFEGGKDRMVLQPTAGPIGKWTPHMLRNYRRMVDVWEELSPV